MLNIHPDMELAGTILSNHHQSIFAIAHLYNAPRQAKTLNTSWPTMDTIIHGQLPLTQKDFQSHYAFRLRISAQHFAYNQRNTSLRKPSTLKATRKDGSQISNSPTSNVISEDINKRPSSLIQNSQAHKFNKRIFNKRHLTPFEVLAHVREWLPTTLPFTRTDYIGPKKNLQLHASEYPCGYRARNRY